MEVAIATNKPEKMAPTFSLDEELLPEIKDWKVGGKYSIHLDVEQVGADKGMGLEPDKGPLTARFKVVGAHVCKMKSGSEESEPEEESDDEESEGEMVMEKDMKRYQKRGGGINKIAEAVRRKLEK